LKIKSKIRPGLFDFKNLQATFAEYRKKTFLGGHTKKNFFTTFVGENL